MKLRGLYAITPESLDLRRIEHGLQGGAVLLQYRRKQRDVAEAREVVALAQRYGVPVIINDDVELALEVGAAGAHLGRGDGDLAAARRRLGSRILGASCYDDAGLGRKALRAGVDYIAFGSVFASPTKPAAVRAPLSLFGEFKSRLPLCAIGGISLHNARQVLDAGADLLAVLSDLFDAPDVARRAAQYRELFA
jgi:thiamine-phosphate pyrophosphorylase